jgi:hypothetical protein
MQRAVNLVLFSADPIEDGQHDDLLYEIPLPNFSCREHQPAPLADHVLALVQEEVIHMIAASSSYLIFIFIKRFVFGSFRSGSCPGISNK